MDIVFLASIEGDLRILVMQSKIPGIMPDIIMGIIMPIPRPGAEMMKASDSAFLQDSWGALNPLNQLN